MNYELAKELKEAGFPQTWPDGRLYFDEQGMVDYACEDHGSQEGVVIPTLSELIEACGNVFESLSYARKGSEHPSNTEWLERDGRWIAVAEGPDGFTIEDKAGKTPEEAVARLWLALNKKA